jgi:hypothetical protein
MWHLPFYAQIISLNIMLSSPIHVCKSFDDVLCQVHNLFQASWRWHHSIESNTLRSKGTTGFYHSKSPTLERSKKMATFILTSLPQV